MRVRVLRSFISGDLGYQAGLVADVDPEKAREWAKSGLVMQDKSLDGAKEVKKETPKSKRKKKGKK